MLGLLGGVVVALIAALGAYIQQAKKLSGKIDTSEAGQLWEESRAIRQDYRDRLATNEERASRLEARVAELEHKNNELAAENVKLLKESIEYQQTITRLRDERDNLKESVTTLEAKIGDRRSADRGR